MVKSEKKLHIEFGIVFQVIKSGYLKITFIVCFLFLVLRATAPGSAFVYILVSEPVHVYKNLINAIVMVESSGDNLAFNLEEEAYGAFQIRPIRLLDYNRRTGKTYKIKDCFNYEISKEIFLYYAKDMDYPDFQLIARNWNGSGKMTIEYWARVKKYL